MHPMAYLGPECPRGAPKKAPKSPKWPILPNFGGLKSAIFSFQILFFRFRWIKHTQKPYFRPLDHFLTTRVPFFVTFLFFKNQSHFVPTGLQPLSVLLAPGINFSCNFFSSPGHIWDGVEYFIRHQNDKMHTVACTQWPIWALNAPAGSPKRPQNPQNGPFCPKSAQQRPKTVFWPQFWQDGELFILFKRDLWGSGSFVDG